MIERDLEILEKGGWFKGCLDFLERIYYIKDNRKIGLLR